MGNSVSRVVGCFVPRRDHDGAAGLFSETLDEGLGHSFYYVRPALESPSASPTHHNSSDLSYSDRIGIDPDALDSGPLPTNDHAEDPQKPKHVQQDKPRNLSETSFKSISGASVSANNSAPRSILTQEQFSSFMTIQHERPSAFESTSSFAALPLQPLPKGIISTSGPISSSISGPFSGPLERGFISGPIERGFMSGPLERGFMSGPLERGNLSGPIESVDRSNFSGPFAFPYSSYIRKRKSVVRFMKNVSKPVKRALSRTISNVVQSQRSLMLPAKSSAPAEGASLQGRDLCKESRAVQEFPLDTGYVSSDLEGRDTRNLQWAQGKAGEDRVHVVLSAEHGWLFVGIYDGFSGPDAPDFLMSNLYPAIYKELKGLLWDRKEAFGFSNDQKNVIDNESTGLGKQCSNIRDPQRGGVHETLDSWDRAKANGKNSDRDTFTVATVSCENDSKLDTGNGNCSSTERFHAPGDGTPAVELDGKVPEDGCCSDRDREVAAQTTELQANTSENLQPESTHNLAKARSLLGGRLKHAYRRQKRENHRKLIHWRLDRDREGTELEFRMHEKIAQEKDQLKTSRRGLVDHSAVLRALARALETTESAYLEMADKAVSENPELALIGSCVLVMLMKDEDVYIMNVGDSRAVLARHRKTSIHCRGQISGQLNGYKQEEQERIGARDSMLRMELERIIEESPLELEAMEASYDVARMVPPAVSPTLGALQLSSDHSTNIDEEASKIRELHPDDPSSITNDRVKGRLKVTRAFGAGFLKKAKWNHALLEVFRIDYVGTDPYITCIPSLYHHRLGPQDRFLVLSSDGLYEYMTNEEVVSHVEWFMEKFPDGDPAQYLIEELLFRAAKKAGMDFHELLDIPHGDRRKYHDDVSVMVISLEGRIWRSCG